MAKSPRVRRLARPARTRPSKGRRVAKARRKVVKRPKQVTARAKARKAQAKRAVPRVRRRAKPVVRRKPMRAATRPVARKPRLKAKAAPRKAAAPPVRAAKPPAAPRRPHPEAPPALNRARRQLADDDRLAAEVEADASDARLLQSARSGREELRHLLAQHTQSSPTLTAGDLDAKWGDAYAVGDEAPGGDNPTPDQDVVDDIGKALGVNYDDNEELKGSEKIIERDRHRWELDPASSDDWPHEER
jgi:hypothetical protein